MRLKVLEIAREDLIDGFHFYENKEENLGHYFIASLYSDIESFKIFAGIHPQVYKDYYRALSKNFPFGIYYTLEAQIVLVRAVVDCRRRPSWIRKHIKNTRTDQST